MRPILIIGAGRMGTALIQGWLESGQGPVVAVEPSPSPRLRRLDGVRLVADFAAIPAGRYRAGVVALKPQILKTMAGEWAPIVGRCGAMLSIAAGVPTRFLRRAWGRDVAIVRAMPNTPGAIGRGITGLYADESVAPGRRKLAEKLLGALGETVWVEKESLIDAVTAISGSGPAYVFALVECMADAGMRCGLAPAVAMRLARATVAGAGALLDADASPAEALRRAVTSPGGTTAAALEILLAKNGLPDLMKRAAAAAKARAKELGK